MFRFNVVFNLYTMSELTGAVFYPLAVGNVWEYKSKDGKTFSNTVKAADPSKPNQFIMVNSTMATEPRIYKEGDNYFTDSFEAGNFQILLKDNTKVGDTWEVKFKANGIDSVLVMTVKEIGGTKEVEGKSYSDVMMIEAESKMLMNGNLMALNFFTQYYYAKGIGLILTTSSMGDSMGLTNYQLK